MEPYITASKQTFRRSIVRPPSPGPTDLGIPDWSIIQNKSVYSCMKSHQKTLLPPNDHHQSICAFGRILSEWPPNAAVGCACEMVGAPLLVFKYMSCLNAIHCNTWHNVANTPVQTFDYTQGRLSF